MKELLISDFLVVEAHRDMNVNLIECFAKYNKVTVLDVNGFYRKEKGGWKEAGIHVLSYRLKKKRSGTVGSRMYGIQIMQLAKQELHKHRYDLMVVLAFDILAYSVGRLGFGNMPVALFHHKNIDELTNKVKRIGFKSFQNEVHHFVFEDFFKEYLLNEIGIKNENCHVVPHPVEPSVQTDDITVKAYDCVGLCNSNSESFIDHTMHLNGQFRKGGYHILLRSKQKKISSSNIEVITGFLETKTYYGYIERAKSVLVPIPNTYVYRLSGSIYDALSRRKIVMTTSNYYGKDYQRRYPGICVFVKDEKDVLKKLKELCTRTETQSSFDKFIEEHSKKYVAEVMRNVIDCILIKGK